MTEWKIVHNGQDFVVQGVKDLRPESYQDNALLRTCGHDTGIEVLEISTVDDLVQALYDKLQCTEVDWKTDDTFSYNGLLVAKLLGDIHVVSIDNIMLTWKLRHIKDGSYFAKEQRQAVDVRRLMATGYFDRLSQAIAKPCPHGKPDRFGCCQCVLDFIRGESDREV